MMIFAIEPKDALIYEDVRSYQSNHDKVLQKQKAVLKFVVVEKKLTGKRVPVMPGEVPCAHPFW